METTQFEERLLEWEINPHLDLGLPTYLIEACQRMGIKHIQEAEKKGENIPLSKLINWPGEANINEALKSAMNLHPNYSESLENEALRREFLEEINELIWGKLCEEISEEGIANIEKEIEIAYITKEISKVIKLEQYYTSIQPLGTLFWERASHELKSLVDDESLIYITEEPNILVSKTNPNQKREIPDWIRGIILAYALQGSSGSKESLNPKTRIKPDASAFRNAALWALGDHLNVHGQPTFLEETLQTFKELQKKRKQANLNLKIIPADKIIPEVEVPPPNGKDGRQYPWLLCWGFLPNTDLEVRELADTWKKKSEGKSSIHNQYRYSMLQRTINFLAKANLLQNYEGRATLRENWLAKNGIKEPTLLYLKERIPNNNHLLFSIIYTESVWKQFAPLSKA